MDTYDEGPPGGPVGSDGPTRSSAPDRGDGSLVSDGFDGADVPDGPDASPAPDGPDASPAPGGPDAFPAPDEDPAAEGARAAPVSGGAGEAPPPDSAGRTGIAALPRGYQLAAALALAVIVAAVGVHVGMLFLHVAPANTVSKEHGKAIDDWVYPEFEQNWKLFAPNPLQQNVAVQARAQIRTADGGSRTTRWYDLSAQDGAAIDHNLLPSHTQQNELRRAWDFFLSTHDAQNRPTGLRGELSERYIRRIVLLRVHRQDPLASGDKIDQVQIRSRTTNVPPPKWSDEKVDTRPTLRVLPWWTVAPGDLPLTDASRARQDIAAEGSAR
ncbi:DUF5819 family protein [Streptomyces sp. NPDC059063]|uniref:DUF5819 family protein n=1 Tax=unclassified Streptomyces TaxID=2593676 RepID=UPI0036C27881